MNKLINNLQELRRRLIFILIGYLICFVLVFYNKNYFYQVLIVPILKEVHNSSLISLDLISGIVEPLKLIAYIAFFIQIPHLLLQVWYFVASGLKKQEKYFFCFSSGLSIILFIVSALLCMKFILPNFCVMIVKYQLIQIEMLTDIQKYFDFLFSLFTGFIICFQLPVVLIILLHYKLITVFQLKCWRKYAFILSFIIAAIITPPDIISQIMLATPLYILYEITILFGIIYA